MGRSDATPRKSTAGAPPLRASELARGTMVGRYIVLGLLGEGGMGTVSAAYDPELDRKVALKLVRADATGEDSARLLREARALARFSHPNVVAVHDVGESDDAVYVAMELVDGVTLREWMRERRAWREVVRVFVAAGRGLAAAHAEGLVHRDVKPANILLGRDGRVRVVDFGLARSSRSLQPEPLGGVPTRRGPLDVVVTAAEWIGTPAYMAPEQFLGQSVDARADQWAFCIALHEALWRVRPFLGNDDEQIRSSVLRGVPVATQEGDAPAALRRAVLRGLAADPDARFPNMNALLAALERCRRRRPLQIVAIALTVALVASAGALAWSLGDPGSDRGAELDAISTRAREAAAQAYFVYPPAADPEHPTAYHTVLELERDDDDDAVERARTLRREFADTLVRLGDRYWDVEGGRGFAIDYYAQALVFEPDDEHARARATLTVGELAALRQRADEAEFSEAELDAAEVLIILAEPEGAAQTEALRRHRAHPKRRRAHATDVALDQLIGERPRERETTSAPRPTNVATSPPTAVGANAPAAAAKPETPSESASDLVAQARKVWKAGDVTTAETLLHRALAVAPGNVAALATLSDLHFDRGAYSKAVDFAERAVARAPKRADLRIAFGDALFKVLRYADARKQYAEAKALGSRTADKRLAQVDAKLGAR